MIVRDFRLEKKMSIEQQIEQFARKIVEFHGFRFNEGFACLIPDQESFPVTEGLFLWGFSEKRKRFETKVEKFHTSTRLKRMEQMLGVPEKEYKKEMFASIGEYLNSLKALGFSDIGKGVNLFGKAKIHNVQADASIFENNLDILKEFEKITLNNPILKFAEGHGYFEVKNRDTLAWDSIFGEKASKTQTSSKTSKAQASKTQASKTQASKTQASKTQAPKTQASKTQTSRAQASKAAAKVGTKKAQKTPPRLLTAMPFADKLKKLAAKQPESSLDGEARKNAWAKQVNALYKKVQTWLSEHAKGGYITFNSNTIKVLAEENLGNYEIDSLELDLVGGHQIIFRPVEMNILGAVGRIDVFHRGYNPHKVMLLLHEEGKNKLQWELWKGLQKDEQQAFTKETLEGLLNQWIES